MRDRAWTVQYSDDTSPHGVELTVYAKDVNGVLARVKHHYGGGAGGASDDEARVRRKATKVAIVIDLKEAA